MNAFRWLSVAVLAAMALSSFAATVDLEMRFDPDEHLILGSMYVSWETPPGEATFALLANLGREPNPYLSGRARDGIYAEGFDPAWTKVDEVVWEGPEGEKELDFQLKPAPPTLQLYSLDDVFLVVSIPTGEGRLRIDFRTRFPHILAGEPGRLSDIYTWRFGWHPIPVQPPTGENWPLVLPSHRYSLTLDVPQGWRAVLPGQVEETAEDDGHTYRATFPSPVRSITLYLGPEEELTPVELPVEGLSLEGVALPGDEDAVRALLTYVPEVMADYEERFGPYPYGRLILAEHPNQQGVAFAADGIVFIPKWYFDRVDLTARGMLSRYGRFVLAHELAHQWWGVGVGVDLDAENWLSEGLAQYSAISWYEETFGSEGGNVFKFARKGLGEALAEGAVGFANLREHFTELPYLQTVFRGFDEAVVKPLREAEYAQATSERLYDKGYLVFRALAHLVGEDLFDAVLAEAAARFRTGTLTVEELKDLLEERSGMDLTPFFESWVWGNARADYAIERVTRRKTDDGFTTFVHLRREGTGFLPVEIEAQGPEGETASQTWEPGETPYGLVTFDTAFPVVRVVVDPGHYVLDEDRLNNVWPPKFVLATTRNELPLDGYLVHADPETRAVQVQYLDRFGWAIYPEELAVEGFVNYGREASLWGFARVKGTLIGQLVFKKHLWSQPETGEVGTWWFPAGDVTLSFSRRPYPVLGLGVSWQGYLPHVYYGGISLLSLPGAGGRIYLSHTQEVDLLPGTYLDLAFGLGLATPGIPRELSFGLPELYSARNGQRGDRKLLLSASVSLPPDRDPYSLAGAALVSRLTPRAYLTWGRLWDGEGTGTFAEAGAELSLRVELLGGVFALRGVVGLVWPLPEGEPLFYFGLGM